MTRLHKSASLTLLSLLVRIAGAGAQVCEDIPGWTSRFGFSCGDYDFAQFCTAAGGFGPGWDVSWGDFSDFAGPPGCIPGSTCFDASQACCTCGGGTAPNNDPIGTTSTSVPTSLPTAAPTVSPVAIVPCSLGSFESVPATASTARQCTPCSRQQCNFPTEYQVAPCSTASDISCALVTTCAPDQFTAAVATPISNTLCLDIGPCGIGEVELSPPTASTDRICNRYSVCDEQQLEVTPPTTTTDRVCRDYAQCDFNGNFESAAPTLSTDRICLPCLNCSSTQYLDSPCTQTSDTVCVDAYDCLLGSTFETVALTDTSDRVCTDVLDCTTLGNHFEIVAPTLTSDSVCGLLDVCDESEFESVPPTATTNRVCQLIAPACAAFQFESQSPSSLQNRICSNCSICSEFEFETQQCSLSSNRICATLSNPCNLDIEFEASGPTPSTDRVCQAISNCSVSSEFELVSATDTSDRVCVPTFTCSEGSFQGQEPTATTDRVCIPVSRPCGIGFYEDTSPTSTSDRVCSPCTPCVPSLEFEESRCFEVQDTRCSPIINCDNVTQFESAAPTATTNRVCSSVTICRSLLQFEISPPTVTSNRNCGDVQLCAEGTFEESPPTPTSNRLCSQLSAPCEFGEFESRPPSDTSDRLCSSCTPCNVSSQFEARACAGGDDTICLPFQTCNNTQYEFVEPTATTDRGCDSISICSATQFELNAPSPSSNRVCGNIRTCREGTFESAAPTSTSDRNCSAINPTCAQDQYESQTPTDTSDRICNDCTICNYAQEYQSSECFGIIDTTCSPLRQCDEVSEFESVAATQTTDRSCAVIRDCIFGQFQSEPPTPTTDRQCSSVSSCNEGFFQSTPPTETTDRRCSPVSPPCLGDVYESQLPSDTSDRICSTCSNCEAGQFQSLACFGTSDTICSNITLCQELDCTSPAQQCTFTTVDIVLGLDTSGSLRSSFNQMRNFAVHLVNVIATETRDLNQSIVRVTVFSYNEQGSFDFEVGDSSGGVEICGTYPTTTCMTEASITNIIESIEWPFNRGTEIGAMLSQDLLVPLKTRLGQRITSLVLMTDGDSSAFESDTEFLARFSQFRSGLGSLSGNLCLRVALPSTTNSPNSVRLTALSGSSLTQACAFNRQDYTPSTMTPPYPYFRYDVTNEAIVEAEAYRFSTDGHRGFGPLFHCGNCPVEGYYELAAATTTTDSICAPVTVCSASQFLTFPATTTTDAICTLLTECNQTQYILTDQTSTTDRACAEYITSCPSEDQYIATTGTATTDRQCRDCVPCPDDQFQSAPCSTLANTQCSDISVCNSFAFEAAVPTATTDRICTVIRNCSSMMEYETQAPTPTSDRNCAVLRNLCGPIGIEFESLPPTITSNRVCVRATQCTPLPINLCSGVDQFEVVPPTYSTDRVCNCTTACSSSQFESVARTATTDRLCSLLAAPCDENGFEAVPPTATSNRECQDLTSCIEDQYESARPTQTSDRTCADVSYCLSDEFEYQPPSQTSDRICEAIGDCGPNQFVQVNATSSSDLLCANCTEFCSMVQTDLVFIVDASGSVDSTIYGGTPGNFGNGNAALAQIIRDLPDLDQINLRIAAITYSTTATLAFDFDDFGTNKELIVASIASLPYEGGLSRIDLGIASMRQLLSSRTSARTLAVLLTSGTATNAIALQMQLRFVSAEVEMLVIGVGSDTDSSELLLLARGIASNVYEFANYSFLNNLNNSVSSNIVPRLCTSRCPLNHFESRSCGANHDRECQPVSNCSSMLQFQSQPPSTFSDRICDFLSNCTDTQFEESPSTATTDRICQNRTTTCPRGSYIVANSTPTSDTVCNLWRSSCPLGSYQVSLPTASTDRECEIFEDCLQSEFESLPPTVSSDRECSTLRECELGNTFESVPPTSTSNRECSTVSNCSSNEFLIQAASLVSNTICQTVSECNIPSFDEEDVGLAGQFVVQDASPTSDRLCSPLTVCQSGEYINVSATSSSDRSCTSCSRTCSSDPLDLVFVIDASRSVNLPQYGGQEGNFERGNAFLADVVRELPNLSDNQIRIAAVTFSTNARLEFDFNTFGGGKPQIITALVNLPYVSGITRTDLAVVELQRLLVGRFDPSRTVIVYLTDGQSTDPSSLQRELAELEASVQISNSYVIRVGNQVDDIDELVLLAGGDNESIAIFNSYTDINAIELTNQLLRRICTSLCPEGSFELIPCAGTSDLVCSPISNCSSEQYIAAEATRTSDRYCTNYSEVCSETEFERSTPSEFSDRICAPILNCSEMEFEALPPSLTSDRLCQNLTVCDVELEYEVMGPTATSDRICAGCEVCSDAQYYNVSCGYRTGGECADISQCSANEYEAAIPTATSDRQCEVLTVCQEGSIGGPRVEFESSPATSTTDRTCSSCTLCTPTAAAVDLVFLIDTSSSIEDPAYGGQTGQFNAVRELGVQIVEELENTEGVGVSLDGVRIAAVTFGSSASIAFDFWGPAINYSDSRTSGFNSLQYSGGGTNTAAAIELTINTLFSSDRGFRNFNTPVVLVLLTDGRSSNATAYTEQIALLDSISAQNIVDRHAFSVGNRANIPELLSFSLNNSAQIRQVQLFTEISQWSRDIIVNTNVSDCLICPRGSFLQRECSELADLQCAPVTVCSNTSYEDSPPTATSDRICRTDLPCSIDEYELMPGTDFLGRVCTQIRNCTADEYIMAEPTLTSNRVCLPCTSCPFGTFEVEPCSAFNNSVCDPWTNCNFSSQYEVGSPTETSDRICQELSICDVTEFVEVLSTATSDRSCGIIFVCSDSQFELIPPVPGSLNRICADVSQCMDSEFEVRPPTATSDRDCQTCTKFCAFNNNVDLVFLVDGSTSVSNNDFNSIKTWLNESVAAIPNISPSETRVAIVTFANTASVDINYADSASRFALINAINALSRPSGGTRTDLAFRALRTILLPQARVGISTIVVMITDGRATVPPLLESELDFFNNTTLPVTRFAFGIGNSVDETELLSIAGNRNRVEIIEDRFAGLTQSATFTNLLCDACSHGEYLFQSCGGFNDTLCRPWTECYEGIEYEYVVPTDASDRICTDATVCTAAEYESKSLTATTDRICSPISSDCCTDCGETSFNSFYKFGPSEPSECVNIFPSCSERFIQINATATTDRQCIFDGDCSKGNIPFDLIWVLDASGSMTFSNFTALGEFMQSITARLELGVDRVRVAGIQFHDAEEILFTFNEIDSGNVSLLSNSAYEAAVLGRLGNIPYVSENRPSNLVHALHAIDEDPGFLGSMTRRNVHTRVVIVTDANTALNDGHGHSASFHLNSIKGKGASVSVIAVGNPISFATARLLATSPDLVLIPGSFDGLLSESFAREVTETFNFCASGSFVSSLCSATGPQICTECATCSVGAYIAVPCGRTTDTVCAICSDCPSGTYEAAPCTEFNDRVCLPCSSLTCSAGSYIQNCTSSSDTQCAPCDRACPSGQYIDQACSISSNTVCVDCSECPSGSFASRTCGRDNMDVECTTCSGGCPAGEYEFLPCREDADRICTSCSDCGEGQYISQACTPSSNTFCADCIEECPTDFYQARNCSASQNALCVPCSESCPDGSFMTEACSTYSDRQCSPCSACEVGQFESQQCTSSTDTQCQDCSSNCPQDNFITRQCSVDRDLQCSNCTSCPNEFFEVSPCVGTFDRICSRCDERCAAGEYEAVSCTATSNRVCQRCSSCGPNEWGTPCASPTPSDDTVCTPCEVCDDYFQQETSSCTPTSPSVCTDCPSCANEQFQTAPCTNVSLSASCSRCNERCINGRTFESTPCTLSSNRVCASCTVCPLGTEVVSTCTESADTLCAPCAPCDEGFFRQSTGSCACSACLTCDIGQFVRTVCTETSNAVCQSCATCATDQFPIGECAGLSDTVCGNLFGDYFEAPVPAGPSWLSIGSAVLSTIVTDTELGCARRCYGLGVDCVGFLWRDYGTRAACAILRERYDTENATNTAYGFYYVRVLPNTLKPLITTSTSFARSGLVINSAPTVRRPFGFALEFNSTPGRSGYLIAKTNNAGNVRYYSLHIGRSGTTLSVYYTPATGSGIKVVRFNAVVGDGLTHTIYMIGNADSLSLAVDSGELMTRDLGTPNQWLLSDCTTGAGDCVFMVGARAPVPGGGRFGFTGFIHQLNSYPMSGNISQMKNDLPPPIRPPISHLSYRNLLLLNQSLGFVPPGLFPVLNQPFSVVISLTLLDTNGGYLFCKSDSTGRLRYFCAYLFRNSRRLAMYYMTSGVRRTEIFNYLASIGPVNSVEVTVAYSSISVSINNQLLGTRPLQGFLQDCNGESTNGCHMILQSRRPTNNFPLNAVIYNFTVAP